ncbi:MAG: hypothetical protein JWP68_1279 [Modestobacter sp.]|nr:hypothetical protein [Modestobacter sp.]
MLRQIPFALELLVLAALRPRLPSVAPVAIAAVLLGVLGGPPTPAHAEDAPTASSAVTEPSSQSTEATESATATATPAPTAAPSAAAPSTGDPATTAPDAADTVPAVEPGDTVVGELVQAYDDPHPHLPGQPQAADGSDGDPLLSWVQTDDGTAVRVPTADVTKVPRGSTVQVTVGEPVQDEATSDGYEPAMDVLAADVVSSAGTDQLTTAQTVAAVNHSVTVVMMQPAGVARDSTTLAQVVAAVNGPVSTFWEQQSGGVVRVGVTATVDWFEGTSSCSNPYALWAEAADRAGWTAGAGKHLLVYVPYGAPGCSYGLGQVGQSMSSGGQLYVEAVATSVIAHELGHNFGLNHSSELQCDRTVEGPIGSTCQVTPYQDYYDVMGVSWSQVGTLSALQQAKLGVLPAGQREEVTPASPVGDHLLSPLGNSTGTRALQLTTAAGAVYWLEYRTSVGQDGWLTGNGLGLEQGVLVRRANPGASDSSLLLDPTPGAPASWSSDVRTVLAPGGTVVLGDGAFTVTVRSANAGGAVVHVVPGRAPVGSLDSATVSGVNLTMSGWALDPDAPTTSVPVHVYVDGTPTVVTADGARPDIAAAYAGAGAAHGWSYTTVLPEGVHTVCAYAIDVAAGPGNTTLGCRTSTVVTRLPVGSLDAVTATGSAVMVAGWALDADRPAAPVTVHVYVDGVGAVLSASASRPDLAAAFAGAGPAHGLSWGKLVSPGDHTVCVYAIDVDTPLRNTALGCRTVGVRVAAPLGAWEVLSAAGSAVTVSGWALDTDQPTTAVTVQVQVDGALTTATADGARADVGAAFPGVGDAHGFVATQTVAPGAHTVCLSVVDPDITSRSTALGCRSISTQVSLPVGSLDRVTVAGSTVTATGWAVDPDVPTVSGTVHVYVDGVGTPVTADLARPDVGAAIPGAGDGHGFTFSTRVSAGTHTVCAYAIDDVPSRNTALGCRSVQTAG